MELFDLNGTLLCIPTVNLDAYNEKPADGNVFIRDYSENEGIYASLLMNGIVGQAIRTVAYGPYDAKAYECPLLVENNA